MEERIIRLEDQVGFIRSDVSDIKADVRRLDTKIDGTRDALLNIVQSVATVRESVTALSAKVERIDDKVSTLESRLDRTEKSLTDRIDEKCDALGSRLTHTEKTLSDRIDHVEKTFTERLDRTEKSLTDRLDRTEKTLTDRIDTQFEHKFFRVTGVLVGAAPVIYGAIVFLQKTGLSAGQIAGIGVGVGVLIWSASFYVTRRSGPAGSPQLS